MVEGTLGDADGLRADRHARVVEGPQGDLEPLTGVAHHAIGGNAAIVEVQLARGTALDPEFALLLAEGEALVGLLDHEGGHIVAARTVGIGDGQDRVVLRDTGIGDPRLLAVEDEVVTVRLRPTLHARGVRAGLTFGQPVGESGFSTCQRREVRGLDRFGSAQDHRHRTELVDGRDEGGAGVGAGDLLDDDAGGERIGAHPVVLLRHVWSEEVAGHQGVVRLLGVAGLLVDRRGIRGDLVLDHLLHRRA